MRRAFAASAVIVAVGLALGHAGPAAAQAPRANGETVKVHHSQGSVGNMPAFVAVKKGHWSKAP
jgi:hypothetical protein